LYTKRLEGHSREACGRKEGCQGAMVSSLLFLGGLVQGPVSPWAVFFLFSHIWGFHSFYLVVYFSQDVLKKKRKKDTVEGVGWW
jgi:hypothetical protein